MTNTSTYVHNITSKDLHFAFVNPWLWVSATFTCGKYVFTRVASVNLLKMK